MSNLFASLSSATSALGALEKSLGVAQNNVTNASTPGYARQRLNLIAADLQIHNGLLGGVIAGGMESSRNRYAEWDVQSQLQQFGEYDARLESLRRIESTFDVAGRGGIPTALNTLIQSFSAWSFTPNSTAAREAVLQHASDLAAAFRQTASELDAIGSRIDGQIRETVNDINEVAARLRDYNVDRRRNSGEDPGRDARLFADLEQLSELVDFTTLYDADGTVTILLGDRTPLVMGETLHSIEAALQQQPDPNAASPNAPPAAAIRDAFGNAIEGNISGGRLQGLLSAKNETLASLRGDRNQPGDLNRLAGELAGTVNRILTSGWTAAGEDQKPGVALFAYDESEATSVARSLHVTPGMRPEDLAAIHPGPPYAANGAALMLAALSETGDRIDGVNFGDFYSSMASRTGRQVNEASEGRDRQAQLAAQSKALRSQLSGVSLDEEAVRLIEYQRAYQAVARMAGVLNELADEIFRLVS